ncbi:MAG: pyrroline-5-carboxylate reductase [Spirochaetaceae bacterium]|jgi:pyrroline-5-carboxylate reductase|nr:pyrroline-5-carboxylate reductase [Spirochaetaceae bacterium]
MSTTIACIGSGNMGRALMRGAVGVIGGQNLGFTDVDKPKAAEAAKILGAGVFDSNVEAVQKGDFVFLAVKPQALSGVLREIKGAVKERNASNRPVILVSMAAGFSINKISAELECPQQPVIRIMPNTPALISQGMIVLAASPGTGEEKIAELERLLANSGQVDRLEEKYLDAVTGLSGSGPAFGYIFIEALADGGVRAGLPRDKALAYAAQTILGAAAMVKETGRHPGELKDMVASPGGTTIAGIAALEQAGFRGIVMNAVDAAFRRSMELG